ncbi:18217_t:CDS:2, partial [Racocetra fulgida]
FVSGFNNSALLDLQLYEAGGGTYSNNSCGAHLVKCEADSIYFDNSCSTPLVECEAGSTYSDGGTYSDGALLVDNNSGFYFGFNDNVSFNADYDLDGYFNNANNNTGAPLVDNNDGS